MGNNYTRAAVVGTGGRLTILLLGASALCLALGGGCGPSAPQGPAPTPIPTVPPAPAVAPQPPPEPALPELVLRGRWLPARSGRVLLATATARTDDGARVVFGQASPSSSDGAFEIVLRDAALDAPGRVELREARLDGTPGDRVVVAFRSPLVGKHDFGKMGAGGHPRLLVAGTVQRVDGPVESERQYVDGEWVRADAPTRRALPNTGVRVLTSAFGEEFEVTRSVADGDGSFRVHGVVDGGDGFWVEATGAWTHSARAAFDPGDQQVAVDVALTCRLSGELAPEHGFDVADLEICVYSDRLADGMPDDLWVIPNLGWHYSEGELSSRLRPPGAFSMCGLEPGTYHVTLRFSGSHEVIQQVNDVEVAGLETMLPMLAAGREALHTQVRVACPDSGDGVDPNGVRVWTRTVRGAGAFREVDVDGGVAEIHGTGGLLDVVAHAPGCRYAIVQTEDDAVELALEPVPATAVEVPLPDGVIRERAGLDIVLTVRWAEPLEGERFGKPESDSPFDRDAVADPRDLEEFEIPLPKDGPLRFELTEPGVYRLGCLVRGGNNTTAFQGASSVRIDGSGTAVTARRPFAAATVNRRVEKAAEDL